MIRNTPRKRQKSENEVKGGQGEKRRKKECEIENDEVEVITIWRRDFGLENQTKVKRG